MIRNPEPIEIVALLPKGRGGNRLPGSAPRLFPDMGGVLPSRREALQAGAAGAVVFTGLHPRQQPSARAIEPITTLVLTAAINGAVIWLVNRLLNAAAAALFESDARFKQQAPAPSGGEFIYHDRFGLPFVIQNYSQPWTFSEPHSCYFSLQDYPRGMRRRPGKRYLVPFDFGERETIMLQMLDEQEELKAIPFPDGERKRPDSKDFEILRETLEENYPKVDPTEWSIDYRRPMYSADWKASRATYGISNKRSPRKKSFVIVEE